MSAPYRAAVIPTRDRHDMLADCINSVVDQVDSVIVIDNLSDPPIDPEPWDGKVGVAALPIDPPNISTLWNVGLALADSQAHRAGADQWDIAVLNSDVTVPTGWVGGLSEAMPEAWQNFRGRYLPAIDTLLAVCRRRAAERSHRHQCPRRRRPPLRQYPPSHHRRSHHPRGRRPPRDRRSGTRSRGW